MILVHLYDVRLYTRRQINKLVGLSHVFPRFLSQFSTDYHEI